MTNTTEIIICFASGIVSVAILIIEYYVITTLPIIKSYLEDIKELLEKDEK